MISGSAGTERCKWRQKILICMREVKESSGGMNRGMAGKMGREKRRGKNKGEDYL